ncbi:HEPN domain-containing protein [Thiomonas arsenitoxydans]|uniref:HEPN domain-containing protein n=2 Tax=Thiomonas TaxID=32012 RepID=UPI002D1FA703|nr:HEPN domain-containing protein [Thiomonas arsenitoxydans]
MPDSACQTAEELPPALKEARDAARKAFKALPSSPERDSILNALGRIGKPSLKRKVRSRVKLIVDAVGTKFLNLELVTDQAVDCRNYYVHGTPGKFSYEIHSDQPIFFTDTLEFVFAASDLIEAGWDIAEWIKQGTTMSHPFGRYRVNYAARLSELKKLLT